jgi:hypothetical protein
VLSEGDFFFLAPNFVIISFKRNFLFFSFKSKLTSFNSKNLGEFCDFSPRKKILDVEDLTIFSPPNKSKISQIYTRKTQFSQNVFVGRMIGTLGQSIYLYMKQSVVRWGFVFSIL